MNKTSKNRKRLLVGIVLILGLLIIFWLALRNTRANTEPAEVVERFYGHWIAATDPIGEELHFRSTYVTNGFGTHASRAAERGEDAILCGTPTKTFSVEQARKNSDETLAAVEVHTDTATTHVVLVKDKAGWWRIDEIDCSAPTILDLDKALEEAQEIYGEDLLNG